MKDFFEDLYDDEGAEDSSEPSFSLYDFKKWLSKQNKPKKVSESIEEEKKDELKNKFKEQFKERIKRKKKS